MVKTGSPNITISRTLQIFLNRSKRLSVTPTGENCSESRILRAIYRPVPRRSSEMDAFVLTEGPASRLEVLKAIGLHTRLVPEAGRSWDFPWDAGMVILARQGRRVGAYAVGPR